ncbi:MAG: hypothetical protein [Namikivirus ozawa]|uniref:Uncharacterized protein n=1 Tax=Bacteriophage sp. TaxID=38018 RepID=A0ABY5TRQ9_9VIRU|nr:MAG: hypothetical protein [Bacteriophage sp.]
MNAITTDEVKAMIHTIDVRLDQKSHYDTDHTPGGIIYHVGDHKYVTLDDYSQTFEDYEWDHNGADWACYLYALVKNNPERIDFYTQVYNIGGMETLETFYDNVIESTPMTIVYPIYKH